MYLKRCKNINLLHMIDNYNYNFVIFAYTRPPYWTELNLLMSSDHFGREPNRKRVCGSLNRTRQNHYGSEPNRTGIGQNHAFSYDKIYDGKFQVTKCTISADRKTIQITA